MTDANNQRLHSALLLGQIVVGLLVSLFCLGAIPFAISVNSRLASIETSLKETDAMRQQIGAVEARVYDLQLQVARLQPPRP